MNAKRPELTLLNIGGMSCAGCVRSVERSLAGVPGVSEVSVNFADQTASIYGTAPTTALVLAVEDAGYRATTTSETTLAGQEEEVKRQFHQSAFKSLLALVSGCVLMADMWFAFLPPMSDQIAWVGIGFLSLIIVLITGGHFYRGALNALVHRSATMDTLIALGTGAAWLYSMIVILVPEWIPADSRHQYFEAALFIIGFVNLGKALEDSARSRTSIAIRKLFDLAPRKVRRMEAGEEKLVPLEVIKPADQVIVLPGEAIPVDGVVMEGEAAVDEAMLTGESIPCLKQPGASLLAGSLNTDGRILMEVTAVGSDTLLAKVADLVRNAQNSKPRIGRLVDRITSVFVPVVVVLAVLTGLGWYYFGPEPALSYAMVTMMSVLIIACPCALGLAIPMSISVGLGRAAAAGVLVRNSEVLQVASKLTTIVFDKTGTLTRGEPEVTDVSGLDAEDLAIVSALSAASEHPLSRGIVRHCESIGIEPISLDDFRSHAGGGLVATQVDQNIVLGSREFLLEQGVASFGIAQSIGSVVYVAVNGELKGLIELQDELRSDVMASLNKLRGRGLQLVMLTGDHQQVAEHVAGQLGIDQVYAGLRPEDKLSRIRAMQDRGEIVGMVGDGINDAAALSVANVGFAMGKGTEIAMESADVTLLGDSIDGVDTAIGLSGSILRNIYQNLTAAFAYNTLLIPVAAGALFGVMGTLINPALAGLAMAMSSISVVLNANRLRFSS